MAPDHANIFARSTKNKLNITKILTFKKTSCNFKVYIYFQFALNILASLFEFVFDREVPVVSFLVMINFQRGPKFLHENVGTFGHFLTSALVFTTA